MKVTIDLSEQNAAALELQARAAQMPTERYLAKTSSGRSKRKRSHRSPRNLPMVCSSNTDLAPLKKKLMKTAGRCLAASMCRHPRSLTVLAEKPSVVRCGSQLHGSREGAHNVVLSPISPAEIVYLVEKNRLPSSAYDDLSNALIVQAMLQVSRSDIPRICQIVSWQPRPCILACQSSAEIVGYGLRWFGRFGNRP
jgi:hypothetical protein